nr:gamma-tubulin complex component 4-like [Ciona intestinalis]|eukprot:XP_002121664.1 gamma-tubulin complex component 4-like [Ciona intestinalis]
MLHDLLFALSGYPGDIFKETTSGKVEVAAGIPNLSPNETSALNYLLHLSTRYIFFKKFISCNTSAITLPGQEVSSDGLKRGCYLKAFCSGLEHVLTPYRECLLNIEKEILKDLHLSLLFVQQETDNYHYLFDALYDVITTIKSRKAHGCQILEALARASVCGNEFVRDSILAITQRCHVVMYNQLSSWLLHGILIDRHLEFFIEETFEISRTNDTNEDEFEETSIVQQKDKFQLRLSFLPSYIAPRVANVICFVGTSLHLFESDGKNHTFGSTSCKTVKKKSSDLQSILQGKDTEFVADLNALKQAKEFINQDFEICIDKIRSVVARELWELCVEHAQLVSNLYMLKDFYLLGRGELFLVFLDEAGPILKNPPSRVTQHDVQQAFLRSAAKIQMEDEKPFDLFSLTITQKQANRSTSFVSVDKMDTGWACLGMDFKVTWPLHTVFKPAVLEKYNHLFKFLLRVKRTQAALQRIWLTQMEARQGKDNSEDYPDSDDATTEMLQWKCRRDMQYFVDNLQYYLQADVLESHFTRLLEKIRNTSEKQRDFEAITTAHDNFLNALLAQCFVLSNTVCSNLIEILDICHQFCELMTASPLLHSKEHIPQQVQELWKLFSNKAVVFFQVLTRVCTHQGNPHVAQLTLRLDYNRYFSSMTIKK